MSATAAPFLTDADLDTINDARTALKAIENRTYTQENSYAAGAVAALADSADDALFRLVNWAKHTGGQDIPTGVLHNHTRTGDAQDDE